MVPSFLFLRRIDSAIAGPEEAKTLAGKGVLRLIQICLTASSFAKISLARQDNPETQPSTPTDLRDSLY